MSTSIKEKAAYVVLALGMTIGSFGVSAEQITFQEYADVTVKQNTAQVEQQLFFEIKQEIFFSALGHIGKDVSGLINTSPVVRISEIAEAAEE